MATRIAGGGVVKMSLNDAMRVLAEHGIGTREDAIKKYGDLVAAKWGEAEREPAIRILARDRRSHGLVVNAVIYFDWSAEHPADLVAAGKAIQTNDDVDWLRKGG